MTDNKFWVVWCPSAGFPTKRHSSETAALVEAERLAYKNPEQEFIVLEATHIRLMTNMFRRELR